MSHYLTKFNWIDILVLIILIRTSYVGFTQGIFYEFLTTASVIIAAFVALYKFKDIGGFFVDKLNLPIEFSNFLGFILLVLGTFAVVRYIRNLLFKIVKVEIFSTFQKYGGLIAGFLRGSLLASLILLCLLLIPNDYIRYSVRDRSFSGVAFLKVAPICYDYTVGVIPRLKGAGKIEIVDELLSSEPSKGEVKSHIRSRARDNW